MSPPQVGGFISQSCVVFCFFPCIVLFSFIHSVPCQPLKVLVAPRLLFSGTLKGTWLVLGQRVPSGALSSKKDLVSISIRECCLHAFEKIFRMECSLHCLQARGCHETRGPHWVGQSCPSPLCLRITQRRPSRAEGKAGPRPQGGRRFCGWGSPSQPFLRTLLSILILLLHERLLSELFDGDAIPVIVSHNRQARRCLSSPSSMENCDTNDMKRA